IAGNSPVLVHNNDPCKTAVLGVHAPGEQLATELRSANPGRVVETYNDRSLAQILPGEFHPQWMGKVRNAVNDTQNYNLAISLDGLKRYGSSPSEIWQNVVKEGSKVDKNGLPLTCATCWEFRQVARAVGGGGRSSGSVKFYSREFDLTDFNPFD
ncbi:hypothetical protein, partial [Actinoplanes siamensis]